MISIIKNRKSEFYDYSYYKDELCLITKCGYFIKEEELYWNDDPILIKLNILNSEKLKELPADIGFFIDEPIRNSLFTISGFKYHNSNLKLELTSFSNDPSWRTSIYNPQQIIERLIELALPNFTYRYIEDDYISLSYERAGIDYTTIGGFVEEGINKFKEIELSARLNLNGFQWKDNYDSNEALFSKEVIFPMLRNMGFMGISYMHGPDEFGKDFVFHDFDKFGKIVHYGMQVKAGNINGRVNGQIDKIIGQLDDAFSKPFSRINEPIGHISKFYIAISGKYTANAIEKIKNKIPERYVRSVYFLDKNQVIEQLTNTYVNSSGIVNSRC